MTNWGNQTTPATGFFFDHTGNSQFWSSPGSFPGGVVTDLYVYCAGDGGAVSGQLVIWGTTGILWQSGAITLPSGSEVIGGQSWVHVSVPSVFIAAQTLNLGFWSSGNVVWTYESSGSTAYQHSVGSPATLSPGGTEGSGALGAYLTYTPGSLYGDNGSAFAGGASAYGDNGASWQSAQVWSDDGTTWHQVG